MLLQFLVQSVWDVTRCLDVCKLVAVDGDCTRLCGLHVLFIIYTLMPAECRLSVHVHDSVNPVQMNVVSHRSVDWLPKLQTGQAECWTSGWLYTANQGHGWPASLYNAIQMPRLSETMTRWAARTRSHTRRIGLRGPARYGGRRSLSAPGLL